MLQRFEFGQEAFDYIKDRLGEGGKALSQCLLSLPLDSGRIFAFLPADSSPQERASFKAGGIMKISDHSPKIVELFSNYLSSRTNGFLVVENISASPADPWLLRRNIQFFSYKKTVCHYLKSKEANEILVEQVIREASSYLTIGILTHVDRDVEIRPQQEVTQEVLEDLVQHSHYIFVSAYDGEGALIWQSPN